MLIHLALLPTSFAQTVTVSGLACPGPMDVTVSGVTAGGPFALITGAMGGQTVIPVGAPCPGTVLDVGSAVSRLVARVDASGTRSIAAANVPQGLCGADLQVLDLSTCTTSAAVPVLPDHAVDLVVGEQHSCALLSTGALKCWGGNSDGRLGLGDTVPRGDGPNEMGTSLPNADLGAGHVIVAVTGGAAHTCALFDDGSVSCWGSNSNGQLGIGDTANRGDGPNEMGSALPAVDLGPGRIAVAVEAGFLSTCAILDDGSVKCWGENGAGQLGLGDTADRGDGPNEMGNSLPAVDLGPLRRATAVSLGQYHTCALLDDGSVKCWGDNQYGQLGIGSTSRRGDGPNEMGNNLSSVDLGLGHTATRLSAGAGHTCAVLDDGSVKCWGAAWAGQLGLGSTTNRGDGPNEMGANLPVVDLAPGRSAIALTSGSLSDHSCALLDDGTVKCWGRNLDGALGLGDEASRGDVPGEMGANLPTVDLGLGRSTIALSAGGYHTCALLDDDSIKCWGDNNSGELGLGDTLDRGDTPNEMGSSLPSVLVF